MAIKSWKADDPKAPKFPAEYKVVKRATLQKTDIGNNNNKYYGIELHDGGSQFRVFTHYGRTDDLQKNPDAGVKENRFFNSLVDADREYNRLYKAKTGDRKGYVEINLASSNIGSDKARGTSSGHVDEATTAKIEKKDESKKEKKAAAPAIIVPTEIRSLVTLIYGEATKALTETVQAKITAKGIETPLGVLTVGQIDKGDMLLKEIHEAVKNSSKPATLQKLSSAFYTTIPHKLGRTKADLAASTIDNLGKVAEKEETLQLMRDMLTVDGEEGASVLATDDVGQKYAALGCTIQQLPSNSAAHDHWRNFTFDSMVKHKSMKILNIYAVSRPGEEDKFHAMKLGNQKPLFHGSRIKNWVGLLTRGTLMPKLVTAMGVSRTDGGWLGNGIYFGNAACTSMYYTSPGHGQRRVMSVHTVALGEMKEFTKRMYGLEKPPPGFHSAYGNPHKSGSQFDDDEFCIYNADQQYMNYLIEFKEGY